MNISSLTNSITSSSAAAVGGLQPAQVTNDSDQDAASSGSGQVHRHHGGGGHMHSAVAAALQSLGLTMPTTTDASAASSSSSTSNGSTSSGSADGSATASSGSVQQDMQQFMHQLFEAVRSDASGATSAAGTSGSTGSADPQTNFASGLSTLIGQVASGTAPAGLQSAFATLTSALQQSGSASSSSSSGSGSNSTTTDQATLQSFLTSLQQNLGYGAASSSPVGSLLTALV